MYISRLIGINRTNKQTTKLLWDLNGQDNADILWLPRDGSNQILVSAQNSVFKDDQEFWPSIYRVDVTTGKKKKILAGKGDVLEWGADQNGNIRVGYGYNDTHQTSYVLYRKTNDDSFRQIDKASFKKDEVITAPFLFLPGGDRALTMRDNEKGMTAIYEIDLVTQQTIRTVYESEAGEVDGAMLSLTGRHCWACQRQIPKNLSCGWIAQWQ